MDLKELLLKIIGTPMVESAPLAFATQFSSPTGYCLKMGNYLIFHYTMPCNTNTSSKIFDLPRGLSADGARSFLAYSQKANQIGAFYAVQNGATSANGLSSMPFYANTWYNISGIIKVK